MPVNKKSIFFNLISYGFAELANKVTPLLILHIVVSKLSALEFGRVNFAIGLIELGIPFVILGYTNVALVDFSKHQDNKDKQISIIWETIFLRLINFFIVLAFILLLVNIVPRYNVYKDIVYIISYILFTTALEMQFVHIATNTIKTYSKIIVFTKLLSLILIFKFVNSDSDSFYYAIFGFGSNGLIALSSFIYNTKKFPFILPCKNKLLKRFKKSLPFALLSFWAVAWMSFDLILVEYYLGMKAVGIYVGQFKIYSSITHSINAIGVIFLGESLLSKSKEQLTKIINFCMWAMFLIALPITVGVWFCAQELVALILNDSFKKHSLILKILCQGLFGQIFIIIFAYQVLMIKNKIKLLNNIFMFCLILTILLCVILQSYYNIIGIAIGSVIGRNIIGIVFFAFSLKYLNSIKYKLFIKLLLSVFVMLLSLIFLETYSFYIKVGTSGLLYLLIVYIQLKKEVHAIFK